MRVACGSSSTWAATGQGQVGLLGQRGSSWNVGKPLSYRPCARLAGALVGCEPALHVDCWHAPVRWFQCHPRVPQCAASDRGCAWTHGAVGGPLSLRRALNDSRCIAWLGFCADFLSDFTPLGTLRRKGGARQSGSALQRAGLKQQGLLARRHALVPGQQGRRSALTVRARSWTASLCRGRWWWATTTWRATSLARMQRTWRHGSR